MDIVCIKPCRSIYLNNFHDYKIGEIYKYNLSRNKNFIHNDKNTLGFVVHKFVEDNFVTKEKYSSTLKDIDDLFDGILNNELEKKKAKILQRRIDDFYRNI